MVHLHGGVKQITESSGVDEGSCVYGGMTREVIEYTFVKSLEAFRSG